MGLRSKLILYNSIIVILLAVLSLSAVWYASSYVVSGDTTERLTQVVQENAGNLYTEEGLVYVDDSFDFYHQGVYLSIYSSDGSFINGAFPNGFDIIPAIEKGKLREAKTNQIDYYVFDYEVQLAGRSSIYLRGILEKNTTLVNGILAIIVVVTIILVILSIGAMFFVSRKITKPIVSFSRMADGIVKSGDLENRIHTNADDSEIIVLEKSFNEMLTRLDLLFKNEQRFTSDVSHELRTPLTVILAESEYCLNEAKTEEDKHNSVQIIYKQTQKLVNITKQLLEFSRFTNQTSIRLKEINLSSIVEEFTNEYFTDKDIKVSCKIEKDIYINGDDILIGRLLQNLTDNAIKYGKNNGYVILTVLTNNNNAVLTVEDNGIGMDSSTMKNAFERFYQADTSRTTGRGVGLGLSFVKEIVRLHNAEISVDSTLNKGTTFKIVFPPKSSNS